MTPKHVVTIDATSTSIDDATIYNLALLRSKIGIGFQIYLILDDDRVLDVSLILLETAAGQKETWEEMLEALTIEQINAYSVETMIKGSSEDKTVRFYDVTGLTDVSIGYSNIHNHYAKNIREMRRTLPDMSIVSDSERNLGTGIYVVNGLIPRPVLFEDTMYLVGGASMCWGCDEDHLPAVGVMDFAPLGGYDIIPFTGCRITGMNEDGIVRKSSDIRISLPEQYSGRVPFLVIANKIIMPDEFKIYGGRNIIVNPRMLDISSSILQRKMLQEDTVYGTNASVMDMSEDEYLTKIHKPELKDECFIILAKANAVSIERKHIRESIANKTHISFDKVYDGVLRNIRTNSILSYKNVHYISSDNLYVSQPKPQHKITNLEGDKHVSVPAVQYGAEKGSVHINCNIDDEYEVVYVSRGGLT